MPALLLVVALVSQFTPSWFAIGSQSINREADSDSIVVLDSRTTFHSVKFIVRGSAVRLHRVVLHFDDDGQQESILHELVPDGGESRAIHLKGAHRAIRRVDFSYDAKTVRHKGAFVQLLGHE